MSKGMKQDSSEKRSPAQTSQLSDFKVLNKLGSFWFLTFGRGGRLQQRLQGGEGSRHEGVRPQEGQVTQSFRQGEGERAQRSTDPGQPQAKERHQLQGSFLGQ